MAQMMDWGGKFLIIGNLNAAGFKEIFPLVRAHKIWLGCSPCGHEFIVPNLDSHSGLDDHKRKSLGYSVWFTNMKHTKRNEKINLIRVYKDEKLLFPKYDNYDAIEVSKVVNIPKDYKGVMGVPISFLTKFNPQQFEIVGLSQKDGFGLQSNKRYDSYKEMRPDGTCTKSSGKKTNGNPVMKGYPSKKTAHYFVCGKDVVHSLYGRVFIKHKKDD